MNMAFTIAEVVSPVRLAQDAPEGPTSNAVSVEMIGLVVAVTVAFAAAVVLWRWARARRLPADERAYRAIAWRLRLGPQTRRAVRGASAKSGIPAVALLLSEHARKSAGLR